MSLLCKITANLFKLVGLVPMSTKFSLFLKFERGNPFQFSIFGMTYNCVFLTFLIIIHAYFFMSYKIDYGSSTLSLGYIYVCMTFLIIFIVVAQGVIKQRSAVALANGLYENCIDIINFDGNPRKLGGANARIFVGTTTSIIWMVLTMVFIYEQKHSLFLTLIYSNSAVITAILVQYVWVVILLRSMIERINEIFTKIFKHGKSGIESRILSLRDACIRSHELSTKVSDYFSLPLLGCMCKIFCAVVFDIYYFIKHAMQDGIMNPIILPTVIWLVLDVFSLLVVTNYVTSTVKEVRYPKIVSKILCEQRKFHSA